MDSNWYLHISYSPVKTVYLGHNKQVIQITYPQAIYARGIWIVVGKHFYDTILTRVMEYHGQNKLQWKLRKFLDIAYGNGFG